MKTAPKKLLLLLSALLLLSLLLLAGCGQTAPTPEPEDAEQPEVWEDTAPISTGRIIEYPVTSDPAMMFNYATAVVIGRYGALEDTHDLDATSEKDYFGARIYPFTVERVVKGELEPGTIHISIPYERLVRGYYHPLGPDGKIMEGAPPEPYSFTHIWEYFMEPDPAETYLLFLTCDEVCGSGDRDYYYPAVEPFTMALGEDDRLELRSNLLLPETERKEKLEIPFVAESGRPGTFTVFTDEIEDRISGMTLDELLAEVERIAQDPEPVQPE